MCVVFHLTYPHEREAAELGFSEAVEALLQVTKYNSMFDINAQKTNTKKPAEVEIVTCHFVRLVWTAFSLLQQRSVQVANVGSVSRLLGEYSLTFGLSMGSLGSC